MKKLLFLLLAAIACHLSYAQNIYTLAGGLRRISGFGDGENCRNARLISPMGLATDTSGNLLIEDYLNYRIRKITPDCIITTVAGNGTGGLGSHTNNNVLATSTHIHSAFISTDRFGNIYIPDADISVIRKISASGIISVFAGDTLGAPGYSGDGGPATLALLNLVTATCSDDSGNLYIADYGANVIRKVNTAGIISTFAGNGTIAYSGDGGAATSAAIGVPRGMAIDHRGYLYVAQRLGGVIRRISLSTSVISTYAGTGTAGYSGDGGPALSAEITAPLFMAFDKFNNLYMCTDGDNFCRKIDNTGIITTFVGNDTAGFRGDGGPAVNAELYNAAGIAVDPSGSVIYVSDINDNRIRMILACTSHITAQPNDTVVYAGTNATFTLNDLGVGAYQWQADTGKGFNDIDTTIWAYKDYENSHTRTLVVPNVTIGMNNFKYRCIRYSLTACPDTSGYATLSVIPLSVSTVSNNSQISIYPNPASNQLNISSPENLTHIQVLDITGKILISHTDNSHIMNIDVSSLSPGLYFVRLNDQYVQKFTKSE